MDADITYCNEQLHKIGLSIKSLNKTRQEICKEIHPLEVSIGKLSSELKKIRQAVTIKNGQIKEIDTKLCDMKFERHRMREHLRQLRTLKTLTKIQNKMIENHK